MGSLQRFLMKSFAKLSRRPKVKVSLERIEGSIVDVGAGGEGVIAKTCGRNTVCVDISREEIDEARSRGAVAQWVLCDACSMPFRNYSFEAATFFFSLMFIKTVERKHAVIEEAKRVLKPNGALCVWDAIIKAKPDLYVIFVEVSLSQGEEIFTGYGVKGNGKEQNLELINKLALEEGFKTLKIKSHKDWFTVCYTIQTDS